MFANRFLNCPNALIIDISHNLLSVIITSAIDIQSAQMGGHNVAICKDHYLQIHCIFLFDATQNPIIMKLEAIAKNSNFNVWIHNIKKSQSA